MSGSPAQFQTERQNLLIRLLDAVKQCQVRFGGRRELATEGDSRVTCLCAAWEAGLSHGMRHTNKALSTLKGPRKALATLKQVTELTGLTKVASNIGIIDNIQNMETEPVFWQYVKEHLSKHETQRYMLLRHVTTEAGRGRAWLRSTLNEHSLAKYMHMVLEDGPMVRSFYEEWSFLRDQERSSMLPMMAAGLGSILFAINIDNPDLNTIKPATGLDVILSSTPPMRSFAPRAEEEPRPVINTDMSPKAERRKERKKKKKIAHIVSFDDDDGTSCSTSPGSSVTSPQVKSSGVDLNSLPTIIASNAPVPPVAGFIPADAAPPVGQSITTQPPYVITSQAEPVQPQIEDQHVINGSQFTRSPPIEELLPELASAQVSVEIPNVDVSMPKVPETLVEHTNVDNCIVAAGSETESRGDSGQVETENIPNGEVEDFNSVLTKSKDIETVSKTDVSETVGDSGKPQGENETIEVSSKTDESERLDSTSESYTQLLTRPSVTESETEVLEDLDKTPTGTSELPPSSSMFTVSAPSSDNDESLSVSKMSDTDASDKVTKYLDSTSSPKRSTTLPRPESLKGFDVLDRYKLPRRDSYDSVPGSFADSHKSEAVPHATSISASASSPTLLTSASLGNMEPSHLAPCSGHAGALTPLSPDGCPMVGEYMMPIAWPASSEDSRSNDSIEVPSYNEDTDNAAYALAITQQGYMASHELHSQTGGAFSPEAVSNDTLSPGELKQALVAMMLRKDEVEQQCRSLQGGLEAEHEVTTSLKIEMEEIKRNNAVREEKDAERLKALLKENELLKHQLRKYVNAVQMLRTRGAYTDDIPGIHFEDPQPLIPPPKPAIDYSHEASEYEKKLIQVAEMHGELMEFNEVLHRQLSSKEITIKRLKQELTDLRGPLPDDFQGSDDSTSISSDLDVASMNRPLVNIWIPSAFLRGTTSDAYHVYQVYVRIRDEEWNVYRRYTEFHGLHSKLKKKYPIVNTYEFPQKKTFGNRDPKFVEERRRKLQMYLRQVINLLLQTNVDFIANVTRERLLQVAPFFGEVPADDRRSRRRSSKSKGGGRLPPSAPAQGHAQHYTGL